MLSFTNPFFIATVVLAPLCLIFLTVTVLLWLKLKSASKSLLMSSFQLKQFEEQSLQAEELKTSLVKLQEQHNALALEHQKLQTTHTLEKNNFNEKLTLLQQTEERLKEQFQSLSSEALVTNAQKFMAMAKHTFNEFQSSTNQSLTQNKETLNHLLSPVKETLGEMDKKIQEVEKNRVGAYEGLQEQIKHLLSAQSALRKETVSLTHALKTPRVRGRWGEIQLKRVVEMAGMLSHCDFKEQTSEQNRETNEVLRPDMVVRLPGGQTIVIDAKTPLEVYMESAEIEDPEIKKQKLSHHARLIRQHIKALSLKSYWSQFEKSPEFVVLFLPGEPIFSAALEADPALIEVGADSKVILATPSTLIALLRAVAFGWRQESMAQNAKEISLLGQTLYNRLGDLNQHFAMLGKHLNQSVQSYNKAVGSYEQRVMVAARRFDEMGVSTEKEKNNPLVKLDRGIRELTRP